MTTTQRVEVYDVVPPSGERRNAEDRLIAVFAFGAEPLYFGEAGETVRTLVSRSTFSYNPIAGGTGYRVVVHGAPPPFEGPDGPLTVF